MYCAGSSSFLLSDLFARPIGRHDIYYRSKRTIGCWLGILSSRCSVFYFRTHVCTYRAKQCPWGILRVVFCVSTTCSVETRLSASWFSHVCVETTSRHPTGWLLRGIDDEMEYNMFYIYCIHGISIIFIAAVDDVRI